MLNVRDRYKKNDNQLWLDRNSLRKNEEDIELMLEEHIKFDKYHFTMNAYGECSLELTSGLEDFLIEIDEEKFCYKIFMRNKFGNFKNKDHHYRLIKQFQTDDIYELLIFVRTYIKKEKQDNKEIG